MNKFIFLLILIVFTGCAQKQDILVTKKVYPDISRDAIFDAAKTLFVLSNETNDNKAFIIDAYRDKLVVNKIMFEDNIIKVDIVVDKWLLEVQQVGNETRANLVMVRRDGMDIDDTDNITENVHQLFWDRLDYLLGLKKDWKRCNNYFMYNPLNKFCLNYFVSSKPNESYRQKNISISKQNIKINTIDTIKTDIFIQTDLTLEKDNKDIFNQIEDIEKVNMLEPVTQNAILEKEAIKKEKDRKVKQSDENDFARSMNDLKDGELLNIDNEMNKFKKDLENITNMKSQIDSTDSNKIISDSNNLKENSEFDLKQKK